MKRKDFIKRSVFGITGLSVLGGFYSWQIEPFWLEFVKVKMPIPNLSKHLIGKTLMQISDIHIGERFDHNFVIESFKKAKLYKPDFVVYTGDYVTIHKNKVKYETLETVLKHSVRGKIGTIGILGNHDYGVNWAEEEVAQKISDLLNDYGIKVLRNQQTNLMDLNFIGFDDYWALNFNPEKAMKDFNPQNANIVLCHNPDVCDLNVWKNYNSWILSGHTHGGQCKPPFLAPPLLPVKNKRYSAGLIPLDNNRTLYINRALGHLWLVRFNVRPEITIFELAEG
ncbi:metallophosphoesterase [Flavobacteriaceae bacterium 14752]|uniref:metallophosphoesterase n=1 Tax=Mesohalobacter salilacus TaxID=2491711 RepID=UPI000F639B51|nr:metallophosphoesterase [Flavobacteriaceae bacterium 14752]